MRNTIRPLKLSPLFIPRPRRSKGGELCARAMEALREGGGVVRLKHRRISAIIMRKVSGGGSWKRVESGQFPGGLRGKYYRISVIKSLI
jgi:hypothetical protein